MERPYTSHSSLGEQHISEVICVQEFPEVTTHAVIFDETQILLIKWKNPLGQVVWAFPGGHIRKGEKVMEALVREVKEETGYDVDVNQLLGVYDNIVKDSSSKKIVAHIINIIWMAKVASGALKPPKSDEVIDVRWFSFASAKRLKMSRNAQRILHDALLKSDQS